MSEPFTTGIRFNTTPSESDWANPDFDYKQWMSDNQVPRWIKNDIGLEVNPEWENAIYEDVIVFNRNTL